MWVLIVVVKFVLIASAVLVGTSLVLLGIALATIHAVRRVRGHASD